MEENEKCCDCGKTKVRSESDLKDLNIRLNRLEGQLRGIRNMLEKNAYCTDILVQVSAVCAATKSFGKAILAEHIRTCVKDDVRSGGDEALEELIDALQKML